MARLTPVYFACCPLCGMSRKIDKTQAYAERYKSDKIDTKPMTKARIRFDMVNPKTSPFIDIRIALGGRSGFPRQSFIRLPDMDKHPEYQDLVDQLKSQIKKLSDVLKEL